MTRRGVTLIELLVAVTLLGFVSLGLLFAMRVGVNAWQHSNSRMAADRVVIAANDLLATQLGGARAQYLDFGDAAHRTTIVYFEGSPERLRFATDYSVAARNRGGVWLAEYWFEHNARNECRLLYNERQWRGGDAGLATIEQIVPTTNGPHVDFASASADVSTRVLYTGIHDCRFEYLIEPTDAPVYWGVAWPGDPRFLPHAVAVRFQSAAGKGIDAVPTVAMVNAREVYP